MLVDLIVAGRNAAVVGGDDEAELKSLKLLDSGARVTVIAEAFSAGLGRLGSSRKVNLVRTRLAGRSLKPILERLMPFVVFVSTGNETLDRSVAKTARSTGAIVCVVDRPSLNDFNMPAVAKVGKNVRVAISTQGMSPAMASILRKRVEKLITREDLLQIKLQGHLREASKKRLGDPASRRKFAYRIINDEGIKELLRRDKYAEARRLAMKMLLLEAR
jgi:siroheme synthase-like protein